MYDKRDLYSKTPTATLFKESKLLKLDCSKAEKILSWKSILSIHESLKLTYDWYSAFYNSENMYEVTKNQINSYTEKIYESNKNKI